MSHGSWLISGFYNFRELSIKGLIHFIMSWLSKTQANMWFSIGLSYNKSRYMSWPSVCSQMPQRMKCPAEKNSNQWHISWVQSDLTILDYCTAKKNFWLSIKHSERIFKFQSRSRKISKLGHFFFKEIWIYLTIISSKIVGKRVLCKPLNRHQYQKKSACLIVWH